MPPNRQMEPTPPRALGITRPGSAAHLQRYTGRERSFKYSFLGATGGARLELEACFGARRGGATAWCRRTWAWGDLRRDCSSEILFKGAPARVGVGAAGWRRFRGELPSRPAARGECRPFELRGLGRTREPLGSSTVVAHAFLTRRSSGSLARCPPLDGFAGRRSFDRRTA